MDFYVYLKAVRSAQHDLTVGDTCKDANVVLTVRVIFPLQYAHLTVRFGWRPLNMIIGILNESRETQVVDIILSADEHRVIVHVEYLEVVATIAEECWAA